MQNSAGHKNAPAGMRRIGDEAPIVDALVTEPIFLTDTVDATITPSIGRFGSFVHECSSRSGSDRPHGVLLLLPWERKLSTTPPVSACVCGFCIQPGPIGARQRQQFARMPASPEFQFCACGIPRRHLLSHIAQLDRAALTSSFATGFRGEIGPHPPVI